MKKLLVLILCLSALFTACGCSLEYTYTADEGAFSFACGSKNAFVTEYRWDGTEEGLAVVIPAEYNGLKIVSVGGFFGRGLPMPFDVDISGALGAGVTLSETYEGDAVSDSAELDFVLSVPENIGFDDIKIACPKCVLYASDAEGKVTEYVITVSVGS